MEVEVCVYSNGRDRQAWRWREPARSIASFYLDHCLTHARPLSLSVDMEHGRGGDRVTAVEQLLLQIRYTDTGYTACLVQ